MNVLEKQYFKEPLQLLLERLETRYKFQGLLWAMDLFLTENKNLDQFKIYKEQENYFEKYLEDFRNNNENVEDTKLFLLNNTLYTYLVNITPPRILPT